MRNAQIVKYLGEFETKIGVYQEPRWVRLAKSLIIKKSHASGPLKVKWLIFDEN
jgi:hypothetical protein